MKKLTAIVLTLVLLFSSMTWLTACEFPGNNIASAEGNEEQGGTEGGNTGNTEGETGFSVYDGEGKAVASSESTWFLDEEVNAVKIVGDDYTLSGKSKYPVYVEDEEVSFMTWKDLEIDSDAGFGFSVWNTYGVIVTLEGDNSITVNGYSAYLKTEKQILGNIGIDMGADLTFVGDGDLNITCGKIRTDLTNKKAFSCGIYSTTGNADLSVATTGKISIVSDRAEGTSTENVLQVGILSDLSVFRVVSGEVDIEVKSSVCSNAEINVYGVFGILAFDGGKISVNVEKRSAYKSGEALALYITENLSSVDFAVENAESIETDIGYKFAQKTAGEKVVVSFNSEEVVEQVSDLKEPPQTIIVPGLNSVTDGHRRLPVIVPPVLPKGNSIDGLDGLLRRTKIDVLATPSLDKGEWSVVGFKAENGEENEAVRGIKVIVKELQPSIREIANGETPTDRAIVVPGPVRIVPVKHTNGETPTDAGPRIILYPIIIPRESTDGVDSAPARFFKFVIRPIEIVKDNVATNDVTSANVVGYANNEEYVSNIVKAIKEKLCYVAIDPEENGEKSTDPKSPLWALLYRDGTNCHVVIMSGGGYVIVSTDGETPTDELVVNLGGSQMRVRIFTPIIPSKNGETPSDHGIVLPGPVKIVPVNDGTEDGMSVVLISYIAFPVMTLSANDGETQNAPRLKLMVLCPPDLVEMNAFGTVCSPFLYSLEDGINDGEGAIAIIGGETQGEETQSDPVVGATLFIVFVPMIEVSADSVTGQDSVIMSIEDLRPIAVSYGVSDEYRLRAGLRIVEFVYDDDTDAANRTGYFYRVIRFPESTGGALVASGKIYDPWSDYDRDGHNIVTDGEESAPGWITLSFEYVGGHLYGVAATPTLVNPKWMESDGEEGEVQNSPITFRLAIIDPQATGAYVRYIGHGEAVDAIIGWSASANIIDGSIGRFFRVIVTDSDGGVTDGVDGEGEQWTVSNEGGTVIIVVPQGASGFFFDSASIESNGESVITGSGFSGNESSQSGGAIYWIGANGRIYDPWSDYDRDGKSNYVKYVANDNLVMVISDYIGGHYDGRRYPAFGSLVPRDIASRVAKEIVNGGQADGEEQAEESETEEEPTFMESRIVTVIGARNIDEVAANSTVRIPMFKPGQTAAPGPNDGFYEIWVLDTRVFEP